VHPVPPVRHGRLTNHTLATTTVTANVTETAKERLYPTTWGPVAAIVLGIVADQQKMQHTHENETENARRPEHEAMTA
jgi:hypothetical protein